jgi:hypothetical protein
MADYEGEDEYMGGEEEEVVEVRKSFVYFYNNTQR